MRFRLDCRLLRACLVLCNSFSSCRRRVIYWAGQCRADDREIALHVLVVFKFVGVDRGVCAKSRSVRFTCVLPRLVIFIMLFLARWSGGSFLCSSIFS